MARKLKVAAAQLGPIHLADTREQVVARLVALMREAAASGCRLVVYPELALTTFFPRYWYDDLAEADRFFEREMPGEATRPLFEEAKRLGIGFHLGYAELVEEEGRTRRFNTAVLVGPGRRDRRQVPEDPPSRARRPPSEHPLPAPREALLRGRRPRVSGVAGVRRDHGHGDLQRSPVAGDVPGHGSPGGRDGPHRLQHPDLQHLSPGGAAPSHPPQRHLPPVRRLPERNLGRGGRQGRGGGRARAHRGLHHRRPPPARSSPAPSRSTTRSSPSTATSTSATTSRTPCSTSRSTGARNTTGASSSRPASGSRCSRAAPGRQVGPVLRRRAEMARDVIDRRCADRR